MNKVDISIVIPCYNEEENIKRGVLSEVYNYLKNLKLKWEVIVSDDGSTDNSRELVEKEIKRLNNFRLLKNPHGGKPSTLLYGFKKAAGDWVLITDMDQSTPIGEIEKLYPFTKNGYDVVIGSRGLQRKNNPWYRQLGGMVFSTFRRTFLLREITDTQCGFKLFKRKMVLNIFPKLEFFRKKEKVTGWKVTSWDIEFLHIAKKKGYRIKEVVVSWKDRDISKSKGGALHKYFKESKEMLLQVLRVKINDIRGMYN